MLSAISSFVTWSIYFTSNPSDTIVTGTSTTVSFPATSITLNVYVSGTVTSYSAAVDVTSVPSGKIIFATPDSLSVAFNVILAVLLLIVGCSILGIPCGGTLSIFVISIVLVVVAPLLSVAINSYVPFCSTSYVVLAAFSIVPSGLFILTICPSVSAAVAVIVTLPFVHSVGLCESSNVGATFSCNSTCVTPLTFPAPSIVFICKYVFGPFSNV